MTWTLGWGRAGPTAGRGLTCESCGQPFRCEVGLTGCWCKVIKLSDATRARLREKFSDCLCRECLIRSRDAETAGGSVSERPAGG